MRIVLAAALLVLLPTLALPAPTAAPALPALPECGAAALAADGATTLGPSPQLVPAHELNACPGIRPGAALVIPAGPISLSYCTMAFIVTDGTDLYVATAGHCTLPELGAPGIDEPVYAYGVPGRFGTPVYTWCEGQAANGGCGGGTDFALIKVDADKRQYVDPAMCAFGAPAGGLFTAHDATLRSVQQFGWGMVIGDASANLLTVSNPATQAREGLGIEFVDERMALLEHVAISGDSGSGVLVMPFDPTARAPLAPHDAPQALGVLTHISVGGLAIVQRLDASLEKAGADMGKTFTLVTSL
jgi:hypothetical protein